MVPLGYSIHYSIWLSLVLNIGPLLFVSWLDEHSMILVFLYYSLRLYHIFMTKGFGFPRTYCKKLSPNNFVSVATYYIYYYFQRNQKHDFSSSLNNLRDNFSGVAMFRSGIMYDFELATGDHWPGRSVARGAVDIK